VRRRATQRAGARGAADGAGEGRRAPVPKGAFSQFRPTADPPCAGCQHETRCRERLEACASFVSWVYRGPSGKYWRTAPREPDHATYVKMLTRRGDRIHRRATAPAAPA